MVFALELHRTVVLVVVAGFDVAFVVTEQYLHDWQTGVYKVPYTPLGRGSLPRLLGKNIKL